MLFLCGCDFVLRIEFDVVVFVVEILVGIVSVVES